MRRKYFSPAILRRQQGARKTCICSLRHSHRSQLEAKHCEIITGMKRQGTIIDIEYQVNLPLIVNGVKICSHIPDFIVTYPDGHKEIIESKGFVNETYPIKHKLTMALYPQYKYNVWSK